MGNLPVNRKIFVEYIFYKNFIFTICELLTNTKNKIKHKLIRIISEQRIVTAM